MLMTMQLKSFGLRWSSMYQVKQTWLVRWGHGTEYWLVSSCILWKEQQGNLFNMRVVGEKTGSFYTKSIMSGGCFRDPIIWGIAVYPFMWFLIGLPSLWLNIKCKNISPQPPLAELNLISGLLSSGLVGAFLNLSSRLDGKCSIWRKRLLLMQKMQIGRILRNSRCWVYPRPTKQVESEDESVSDKHKASGYSFPHAFPKSWQEMSTFVRYSGKWSSYVSHHLKGSIYCSDQKMPSPPLSSLAAVATPLGFFMTWKRGTWSWIFSQKGSTNPVKYSEILMGFFQHWILMSVRKTWSLEARIGFQHYFTCHWLKFWVLCDHRFGHV